MPYRACRSRVLIAICGLAIGMGALSVGLRQTSRQQRLSKDPTGPSFVLHSVKKDKEVCIPFEFRNGELHVRATVQGKQVDCLVDTGTNVITCPQTLNLQGRYVRPSGLNGVDGQFRPGKDIVLPEFRLGDYELRNVTVTALAPTTGSQGNCDKSIVLGA